MQKSILEEKSISNLIEVLVNRDDNSFNDTQNYNRVIYSYDFVNKKYTFISEGIVKLIGYTLEEINKIGFPSIVEKVIQPKYNQLKVIPKERT